MAILKPFLLVVFITTISYGQLDFLKFGNICKSNLKKNCKNMSLELSAIKYLLEKKIDSPLYINGVLDEPTKRVINTLKKVQYDDSYKERKDIFDKLLYGHKLYISQKKVAKIGKKFDTVKSRKIAQKSSKLVVKSHKNSKKNRRVASKSVKKINKTYIKKPIKAKSYYEFKRLVNLRKSYAVYMNSKLLKSAKPNNSLLKVDISEQRVKLIVRGKVALSAPCTTGAKHKFEPNSRTYRDKRTPIGSFRIMEKIANKRSTIFGDLYRGGKKIYHGDRRKYKGSWRGVKFVGAPLKNWMRITSSGIGLHASHHIKRYPGSNGCIRIPPKVATTIFRKVKAGTKVRVTN